MLTYIQATISGLATGSLYALIAIALVLIYQTTQVVNFAQGVMAMVMTYVAYEMISAFHLPFWPVFLLTLLLAFGFGVLIRTLFLRPIESAPVMSKVIMTLGVFIFIQGLAGILWGFQPQQFPLPFSGSEGLTIGAVTISQINIATLVIALLLLVTFFLFLRYTQLGTGLRAVAQNSRAARLMGIRVDRMLSFTWGISTLVGAVAGIMVTQIGQFDPGFMDDFVLKAFAGAVIGGFESLSGAVLGCLLIGVIDAIVGTNSPSWHDTVTFVILLAILYVRPAGLFGKAVQKKV